MICLNNIQPFQRSAIFFALVFSFASNLAIASHRDDLETEDVQSVSFNQRLQKDNRLHALAPNFEFGKFHFDPEGVPLLTERSDGSSSQLVLRGQGPTYQADHSVHAYTGLDYDTTQIWEQPPAFSYDIVEGQAYSSHPVAPPAYGVVQPHLYPGLETAIPNYWDWTALPTELLFHSFQGGPREPRLAQQILYLKGQGWVWELEAGTRVGLVRYGTPDSQTPPGRRPEGWQLDVEGAALPRLNVETFFEVDAVDFKVGFPITYSKGNWQYEFAWYHLSSHVGDEFLIRHPTFKRLDYLRDAVTFAIGYYATPDLRLYGEVDYAYNVNGGSEPWHFQFGFDYMPVVAGQGLMPTPFLAVNGQIREEVDYSGGVNVFAGLMWQNDSTRKRIRAGLQYYNGKSFQFSFFDTHEELLGFGVWYDF